MPEGTNFKKVDGIGEDLESLASYIATVAAILEDLKKLENLNKDGVETKA